jgi:nickel-dependent lactate racemase
MKQRIGLRYGKQKIELRVDSERVSYNLEPSHLEVAETHEEIKRTLSNPLGSERLMDIVKPGNKVVVLGDDATRLTPTKTLVPYVLDEINAGGVPDEDILLIIATGTHRAMTERERWDKYGPAVTERVRVLNHDCLDQSNLVACGVTRRGTDIWINRMVIESDVRVAVGNIVPHHPTGWSGGAKMLLPGVAGQHTTGQMHLLGATEQQLGKLETPCREEMEDFAEATGLDFIVNTILNSKGEVIRIVSGHFIEAHREGVRWGQRVYGVPFQQKSDITVSSTFPVDHDLFQADKGLFSAAISTNQNGEIILLSPCYEGVSPTHPESVDLASLSDDELFKLAAAANGNDPLSIAEVLYLNSAKKGFNITLASEGISEEIAWKFNFNHIHPHDLQEYVDQRMAQDSDRTLGIIHNSAETLPIYKKTV